MRFVRHRYREEGSVRLPLFAALAVGLAAGCTEDWSALKPPPELFRLDTTIPVPAGQPEVHGRVGDAFRLPLGKDMDHTQLGWLRVIINTRVQGCPEFDTSSEGSSYVFRADHPGRFHVEIRREVTARIDKEEDPEKEPEPPRRLDPSWPPRVWDITITE
jgi:hypothetical protein